MVARRTPTSSPAFFQELYAIVVGLGLAVAVEQVIDLGRSGFPIHGEHVAVFLAYLNMAFALAHASVRYLQIAYDERELSLTKQRVFADLVLGVGHFLWLLVLSFLITRPTAFAVVAVVLLIGRPIRDGLLAVTGHGRLVFDRKVAIVQLATAGLLTIALGLSQIAGADAETVIMKASAVAASAVFGLGLYLWAFDFFFPTVEEV